MGLYQDEYLASLNLEVFTPRVLNLNKLQKFQMSQSRAWSSPFFENKTLNSAIIVKHKISFSESEDFPELDPISNKLIIPFDKNNLNLGYESIFVEQDNFDQILAKKLSVNIGSISRDITILKHLQFVVNFEPFLLKEYFKIYKFNIDECYFPLRMNNRDLDVYMENQTVHLLNMIFNKPNRNEGSRDVRDIAKKILNNDHHCESDVLIYALKFDKTFFSWKLLMFYKFTYMKYIPNLIDIFSVVDSIIFKSTNCENSELKKLKDRMSIIFHNLTHEVNSFVQNHDILLKNWKLNGDTDYLSEIYIISPLILSSIASKIGDIEYLINSWKNKFSQNNQSLLNYEALYRRLLEFESTLGFNAGD